MSYNFNGSKNELIRFLISKGLDVNPKDVLITPLMQCISTNNLELFTIFLEGKAEINPINPNLTETPLTLAMKLYKEEYIELLLENGAEVNPTNHKICQSPLELAITSDNLKLVKQLLSKEAKLDKEIITYNPTIFKLVKSCDTDAKIKTPEGHLQNPTEELNMAISQTQNGVEKLKEIVGNYGVEVVNINALRHAVSCCNKEAVDYLLSLNCIKLDPQSTDAKMLLRLAFDTKNEVIVEKLKIIRL